MNCEFLTSNRDLRIFIDIENKKNLVGNFSSSAVVKQFFAEFQPPIVIWGFPWILNILYREFVLKPFLTFSSNTVVKLNIAEFSTCKRHMRITMNIEYFIRRFRLKPFLTVLSYKVVKQNIADFSTCERDMRISWILNIINSAFLSFFL